MIKYKCRPAIHTKVVCEYCEKINFLLPNEYSHFKYLDDNDLISFNTITNLLNFIEKNTTNPFFFVDLVEFFTLRLEAFTKIDLSDDVSNARKLLAFTKFYNQVSDLNWSSIETEDSVGLVANRAKQSLASKYDDLFVYASVMHVLKFKNETKSNIIIELPFERAFYGSNVDLLDNVKFNCEKLSVFVKKDERDMGSSSKLQQQNISKLERISAAANSIAPAQLSLPALANMLGMSTRSLQREVKTEECCVKDIIKQTKANSIISILNKNNKNIKVTAYECGFDNLATFSRHFSNTIGCCPTQYVNKLKINPI